MNFFYGFFFIPSVSSLLCYKQQLNQTNSDGTIYNNCAVCQALEYNFPNGTYFVQNCITGNSGCVCPTSSMSTLTRCQCCSADLCNTVIFETVKKDSKNTLECYDQELQIYTLTGITQYTSDLSSEVGCSMCMILNETNYGFKTAQIIQSCVTNQTSCVYDKNIYSNPDSIYTATCCYKDLCNNLNSDNPTIPNCSFTFRFGFWNVFGTLFLIVANV
ncbi:uncharacterized protein LOC105843301 [Hydra vulgaris]|uniref:uncharacterized protein LOC105843301 n=1 Tax=Hydra vulgaris TaxID=6087 RepID=UPI00064145C7|nr:uncharacterized protein LOC105843301 [Hydra vulgaris]